MVNIVKYIRMLIAVSICRVRSPVRLSWNTLHRQALSVTCRVCVTTRVTRRAHPSAASKTVVW